MRSNTAIVLRLEERLEQANANLARQRDHVAYWGKRFLGVPVTDVNLADAYNACLHAPADEAAAVVAAKEWAAALCLSCELADLVRFARGGTSAPVGRRTTLVPER